MKRFVGLMIVLSLCSCTQLNVTLNTPGSDNEIKCTSTLTPYKTVDVGASASTSVGPAATSGDARSK